MVNPPKARVMDAGGRDRRALDTDAIFKNEIKSSCTVITDGMLGLNSVAITATKKIPRRRGVSRLPEESHVPPRLNKRLTKVITENNIKQRVPRQRILVSEGFMERLAAQTHTLGFSHTFLNSNRASFHHC